jgi:hypothetical protein
MVPRERLKLRRFVKTAAVGPLLNPGSSVRDGADFTFERSEIAAYRSLDTLPMKAGVSRFNLVKLVAKELADNGLDNGGTASIELSGNGFIVTDDGPGIASALVPLLFSVARNPRSSKYLRRPTRGAVGNGLRVVVGAVLASHGTLIVSTRGHRLVLEPQETDGTTRVVSDTPWDGSGTEVEITFGPALTVSENDLTWAKNALAIGNAGKLYAGASSPWWYDADAFFELFNAARDEPVRELVGRLDGCTARARSQTICVDFKRRTCRSVTRAEAAELLRRCRDAAKPVTVDRLGRVGRDALSYPGYATTVGAMAVGKQQPAEIPFRVEVWAKLTEHHQRDHEEHIEGTYFLNRTPATGDIGIGLSW